MLCRETLAAWLVGGGIWLAGLGGLFVVSSPMALDSGQVAADGAASYFAPARTWTAYQDPSGKYQVVERTLRRVLVE